MVSLPYGVTRFHLIVLVVWQLTMFLSIQMIFGIFSNYVPQWRCLDNNDNSTSRAFSKDCLVFNSNCTIEYENNYFYSAAVHFKWVCSDLAYLTSVQSQVQFVGVLLGTVIFGFLSDLVGRKPISLFTVTLGVSTTIYCGITQDMWHFVFCRFFVGLAVGGALNSTCTFVMELLLPKQRMALRAFFNWGVARFMLTVICYYFNDYKSASIVCGVIALPIVFIILFIIPESPTYLHNKGKIDLMIRSEKKIAQISGVPFIPKENAPIIKKETICSVLSNRDLIKKLVVLWIMWFCSSLCGYGMDLHSNEISGNLFINQLFFSITIWASKPILPILDNKFDWFTRRFLHQSSQGTVIICFAVLSILVGCHYNGILILLINVIGIIFIEYTWDACYLCVIELMPTNVRSSAMGSCSMMARCGAILAPMLPFMNAVWPGGAYATVAVVGSINLVVSYLYLSESKNVILDHVHLKTEEDQKEDVTTSFIKDERQY
uniref:MFS domain-containing protein n=1 Tax=Rhabditophanes sp. KR3021 TaxID=114890 RepID=A0AC35TT51_9BILA